MLGLTMELPKDGVVRLVPLYQERVWGGRRLATRLGRALPGPAPIGEAWEVVDRPEAQSTVADGPWAGWSLRRLVAEATAAVMGPRWAPERPFPLLIKWLDCRERLSLQVHPPAEIAPALKGLAEPKTEVWYIAEADPEAALLAGVVPGTTRSQFAAALRDQTAEALVQRLPVAVGDSLFVPSGRLHAIDAGNLILEVQQNSDTTYRVYDWGRVGLDGKPRTLHLAESLACIDFHDTTVAIQSPALGETVIADSPLFRVRRIPLVAGNSLSLAAGTGPYLLHLVAGAIRTPAGTTLARGDNVLVPYACDFAAVAEGEAVVLVSDRFV